MQIKQINCKNTCKVNCFAWMVVSLWQKPVVSAIKYDRVQVMHICMYEYLLKQLNEKESEQLNNSKTIKLKDDSIILYFIHYNYLIDVIRYKLQFVVLVYVLLFVTQSYCKCIF